MKIEIAIRGKRYRNKEYGIKDDMVDNHCDTTSSQRKADIELLKQRS